MTAVLAVPHPVHDRAVRHWPVGRRPQVDSDRPGLLLGWTELGLAAVDHEWVKGVDVVEIRAADRQRDAAAIGVVLGRAFGDDPVTLWVLPGARGVEGMFTTLARHVHPASEVAVDGGVVVGAALWDAPGYRPSVLRRVRSLPGFLVSMRRRFSYGPLLEKTFKTFRPTRPHWYLAQLGTDPAWRGNGVGGALLRSQLDRCDLDGTPVYLENSNVANLPFYQKAGFSVTHEITLPDGPTCWGMWRDAP